MKICYLGAAESYHVQKWCKYFASRGHEVHVISFTEGDCPGASVHYLKSSITNSKKDTFQKIEFLFHGKQIKTLIKEIDPDIIHAHRIPSYGGACAIGNIHPFFLSVWGGDVYTFPNKSIIHRELVKYVLRKADVLMSTSRAMAQEANKYTSRDFLITPFGVDCSLFSPDKRKRDDNKFVVGNIKSLEKAYGIQYLIEAVAIVRKLRPDINIELRIAGKGKHENDFKKLADNLGITPFTHFLGFLPQEQVAEEWANMDVAVITSENESFGVSAVEAQACQIPVVISEIPGLMEATDVGKSSLLAGMRDSNKVAEQIIYLYDHPAERRIMGINGREFVLQHYEYNACYSNIESFYSDYLKRKH